MKNVFFTFIVCLVLFSFGNSMLFSQNYGDINEDRSVDIKDALLVAQYYVGLITAIPNEINADVDCNRSINIIDALFIAQYYVHLIDRFPCDVVPTPVSTPVPVSMVELGIPFELKYSQSAQFDGENILTFTDVISDSRCPLDFYCFWQGEVEAQLEYSDITQMTTPFTLLSVNITEEQIGDYIFVIDTEVLPPRGLSTTTIDKNNYIITITITKAEPVPPLITVSHTGIQCESETFPTEEAAKEFLEANGITVYSIRTESMVVCAACGCPSGTVYYARISIADYMKARELGWR